MNEPAAPVPDAGFHRLRAEELERRLREAEETLEAIRNGDVDAVVVGGPDWQRIYTLETADRPYRLLIEQMQEGAVTLAADGTVLYCNRRLAAILRVPEEQLIGGSFHRFVAPEEQAAIDRLLAGSAAGAVKGEFTLCRGDGGTVPVYLSFIDLPDRDARVLCGVVTDLTQQKLRTRELAEANARLRTESVERGRTEAQLRQAQKMEAVGQLTGGLAHDFNNLLTVIVGNLQLVQGRVASDPGLARQISHALAAAERGAKLTQQLLAFSRRQNLQSQAVCVTDLLPGLQMLLHHALGGKIEVQLDRTEGLWHCLTDPNQLESAILNLAINARDAMPAGGRLTMETGNMVLDETGAAAIPEAAPGRYVTVSVVDTGHGMPPEVMARAFEPFFTTKEVGSGSGLGLSMVYGFARQSGGYVTIDSVPDQGTMVRLYLPWTETPAGVAERPAPEAPAAPSWRDTVLVVEDDPDVRTLALHLIEDLGHTVLSAANGPEALNVLDRHADVSLLFSDIVMPGGMSGIDLARVVRRRRPEIAVLLTSGYTPQALVPEPGTGEEFRVVRKPYRREELAGAIRTALEHWSAQPGRGVCAPPEAVASGPRVLVVEDDRLIGLMLELTLRKLGYEVVGPALHLEAGLEAAHRERLDGALLDINLAGRTVFPVADVLSARGIPFAFMTGYGRADLPEPYHSRPSLAKPYGQRELEQILAALLSIPSSLTKLF